MKKIIILGALVVLGIGVWAGWGTIQDVGAQIAAYFETDPDMGPFEDAKKGITKEDFMLKRSEGIALKRGIAKDMPFDPQARPAAIQEMDRQEDLLARSAVKNGKAALLAAWTPIGPAPIPNGQTSGVSTPVSGRTIAIAVHPTNPDIVYVGTAQGGVYRTTDGGTNWTPIFDNAESLAVGAIAISPSQPETIYIGTGEPNFSQDSFFGVGVYRIDNASTAATVSGPFNKDAGSADVFSGRGIGEIVVHPTDPNTIFVASTSGLGGLFGGNIAFPSRGIYRSTNAAGASPVFAKLTGLIGNLNVSVRDIAIDPTNPNVLVCVPIATGSNQGGIYRTVNALDPTPGNVVFTQTFVVNSTSTSTLNGEVTSVHPAADTDATFYAAMGNSSGQVLRSTDGGANWVLRIDNNFCGGQCFYDIAIAVDPTDKNVVYLGGDPTIFSASSSDGGATFTDHKNGVHSDTHAMTVSPADTNQVWLGTDGGIYKSTDKGLTWVNKNNTQYSATQFMGIDVHPTDPNFTLGGTQDNGTNFYQPDGTWFRADYGDGGYAVIDQNATDTTNVRMYHTYYNQTTAMGYGRVTTTGSASDGNWSFFGCGFGGTANGMTCSASAINFYAPMERGPGNPNTLYFGSDVLYRSADGGTTMTKVSQEPIVSGVAIDSIGISNEDDNVRIVGLKNGAVFGTSTGSTTLTNLDAGNAIPDVPIARTVIDPNNATTAYVTLSTFGSPSVWKTTNLDNAAPTWTAMSNGLPQVPVSAFLVDPLDPMILYAGTDIGVYASSDAGSTWAPFGTGLPRVAVFGIAKTSGNLIRIATHGRGMWQTQAIVGTPMTILRAGTATLVSESCQPANGVIDPGETVTVAFPITNNGTLNTTNDIGTLQNGDGVTGAGTAQSYGVITSGGGMATRNFTFTADSNLACGAQITATIQHQDGATNLGNHLYTLQTGAVVSNTAYTENFDAVTAPALPTGFSSDVTGAGILWTTSTTNPSSAPNDAFGPESSDIGLTNLSSPVIAIPAGPAPQLTFKNVYNLENSYDGMVLEIKIGSGAFADILTAGGIFVSGGYTSTIDTGFGNPLGGRSAWSGLSGGTTTTPAYVTTVVTLPAAASGQNIQLRWRVGSDNGVTAAGSPGVRIDDLSIATSFYACCTGGSTPTPTPTPTATPSPTPTATPSPTPTATPVQSVTVSGRVLTPDGRGINNANVVIYDINNVQRRVRTNSFGGYRFDAIPAGQQYLIAASARRYVFQSQNIQPTGDIVDLDFVGID